ncbi:MAG: PPE family protein [Mycobacterium sp.]
MDFGMLSPEINSGRMYSGPGSGPMMAAAAAWDRMAAELRSAADSYSAGISGLTAEWQGPSSSAMAAAAAAYATWMNATAAQAEQTASQARDAVTAYETAFAGTVPPPLIAANRAQLTSLVATNILGQNTSAIAATEAQYADMWAQDAAAMYGYAGQSATASQVTPFTSPPQTTNPGGLAAQSAGVAQATGTSAGTGAQSTLSQLMSRVPSSLQSLATPATAAPGASSAQDLASLIAPGTPLTTLLETYELAGPALLPARNVLVTATSGMAMGARGYQTGVLPVAAAAASPLAAGLGPAGSAGLTGAASAGVGDAGLVGALSVPPSWAAATPAVRLAAAALQGMSVTGAPVVAAASQGTVFGQMALASLAGGALGNTVPRAAVETGSRAGGPSSRDTKESPGDDKDSKTSDKLTRVLADLSQKPESVQHWHTDKANLESLLEALSKKPGVHAVHVSSRNKPKPEPPRPRWG